MGYTAPESFAVANVRRTYFNRSININPIDVSVRKFGQCIQCRYREKLNVAQKCTHPEGHKCAAGMRDHFAKRA